MNNLISSNIDPNNIVTGGIREGKNLFYSFTEFSITNNEEFFFTNTEDIDNIFLRVTGDFSSQINGTIKIENDTNLFLINPTGMIRIDSNERVVVNPITSEENTSGVAFYAYGAGLGLGKEFSRFRNFEQPGGSILATGGERDNIKANLSEWVDEGIIFESL